MMKKNRVNILIFGVLSNVFSICYADVSSQDLVQEQSNAIKVPIVAENKPKITGSVAGTAFLVFHEDKEDRIDKGWTDHSLSAELGLEKSFLVCNSNMKCVIKGKCTPSEVGLSKAYGKVGYLTIGYHAINLFYKKSNGMLPITVCTNTCQIKWKNKIGNYLCRISLEKGVDFKIGKIEKDKKNIEADRVYKNDDKEAAFKSKNDFPIVSVSIMNIGNKGKWYNVFLSGLFRFLNYYKNSNENSNAKREYMLTWGGNVGMTLNFIPDDTNLTLQGFYSYGIGQYVVGLASLEKDKQKPQAVSVYHVKGTTELQLIQAWGIGVTFTTLVTSRINASISGSFLTTVKKDKEEERHTRDFRSNIFAGGGLSYKFNDHLKIGGEASLEKKSTIDDEYSKKKASGGISMTYSL